MDNKFDKNKLYLNKRDSLYIMMCVAFLETMSKTILTSSLMNEKKWKDIYRKIKKLECDVTNPGIK